jgi:PAS domain S-box-containing protein
MILLSTVRDYAFAVFVAAAAVGVRWLLDPLIGDSFPFITLFGAVAAAVWLGGWRTAVVAAFLGYIACEWFFVAPRGALGLDQPANVAGLFAYAMTSALIIAFGQSARRAQGRASEGRELLRVTLRSIGDAVITTDVRGSITYLNEVAENLTGWDFEAAHGKPLATVFNIVNESTGAAVANPAVRALREGVVVGLANHTLLIRRDGTRCAIDDSAAPIRNERGDVSGCALIFRDVSAAREVEREKAHQLLSARFLAAIVESSDDAIISKNLAGIIQSWNAAAERMFGHRAEEAIGKHISLVIPPDRITEEDEIIARLRAGDRIHHYETERVRSDGRRIQVSLSISPIRDASGTVVGASKIARDITERKRAEAERQKFVTLVESSTDFIGLSDLNGIPLFVNQAGLELVGLRSLGEAMSTPVREFFFPEDQSWIMDEFFPTVLKEGHGEVEVRFRHFRTGQPIWMAYKVLTLTDDLGQPNAFATVSQNVTDRRHMLDQVRALAANLSDADRRKNEFLATLAHELRNPLAPISNAVQALRRRGSDDARVVAATSEVLERQVRQMSRLVDDLVDMSRITVGRIELRRERLNIGSVVKQAVETTRPQFRNMHQELSVSMPDEDVVLSADPMRLAQVLGNLLNNASKFSERGGHVWLTVSAEDGEVVITVRDKGIGMVPAEIPRVFDMFTQLDSSRERSRDGLGIGLTLVKTLVELHGGSVLVHSEGLGRGSEFIVRLPRENGMVLPPVRRDTPAPAAPHRRILIVDDNEDGATSLAMLLNLGGHETFIAHDGGEALEAFERIHPEVALLDIGLPVFNGYEVARKIREQPSGKDVLLIAVTGWGQENDRSRSREAGFDAHLVKPVDHAELMKILSSIPSRIGAT